MIRRAIAVTLSALVLIATGFARWITDSAGQQESGLTSTSCADAASCDGTTILLVGSDARVDAEGNPLSAEELAAVATEADGGGLNTDTIMLIHVPAGGGAATAISIPRDSWVADPPPGPSDTTDSLVAYSPNKVNSFYGAAKFYVTQRLVAQGVTDQARIERESSNAGRKMLITVVERMFNAHVDHYAEVNLFGFYLLSNAIGGVPVCLTAAVDDPFSGAKFAAGPQEVQGTAALAFVRQRHGLPNGDLDRVKRQQAFLSGAISKVLSVGTLTNPAKLSSLIDAANRSIVLSQGFDLLQLAEQMASISSGNIKFQTLPTHGAEPNISSDALHVDLDEIRALYASLDVAPGDRPVDPASVTVDVRNGTVTTGLAATVSQAAVAAGFVAGELGNVDGTTESTQQATTTIRYTTGQRALADAVAAALGFGTPQEDTSVPAGHVIVVVGTDRVGQGLRSGHAVASTEPTTPAAPTDTITAAQPGCVN